MIENSLILYGSLGGFSLSSTASGSEYLTIERYPNLTKLIDPFESCKHFQCLPGLKEKRILPTFHILLSSVTGADRA